MVSLVTVTVGLQILVFSPHCLVTLLSHSALRMALHTQTHSQLSLVKHPSAITKVDPPL